MLKGATRREFDQLAVWSTDRLGRSLQHFSEVLLTLRETGTELFVFTRGVDTTTPAGRALFQMLGVFCELEREMIVERINAGIKRAKAAGKHCGRPALRDRVRDTVKAALIGGASVRAPAKLTGVSVGTVASVRRDLAEAGAF